MISAILYMLWLIPSLNMENPAFAVFFLLTSLFGLVSSLILVINNWSWSIPSITKTKQGEFSSKQVAVIVPTWQEDPEMVQKTLISILEQDYPIKNIFLIVSDDSSNPMMQNMVNRLSSSYAEANIVYHIPYGKNDERRKGEGKAGNLNSALELVVNEQNIDYIETRDADDLVGSKNFLSIVIDKLESERDLAYVQTIKDVITSNRDPFANKEKLFYRSLMLSKNSANAVFPCGSGLVWRKEALVDIGGFPSWNLVEDFQSGAEALRRGWRGLFIPIVGAIGQVAPEDILNVYKQRSTWAIDSVRFLLWGNKKGLKLRQKLHFYESGLFYIASGAFFLQALVPIIILITGETPVEGDIIGYSLHLSTHIFALYLFVLSLMRRQAVTISDVFRSLQISFSLGPVYIYSILKTIILGKDKKARYVVTRKESRPGLYLWHVKELIFMSALILYAIIKNATYSSSLLSIDFISIFWSLLYLLIFSKMIKNSWFNWNPIARIQKKVSPHERFLIHT